MKQGDQIELEIDEKKISARFVKEDKNYLTIKLKSGYNTGILKSKIKSITTINESEKKINKSEEKKTTHKSNKKLSKITILHTGGTIASKVDYATGAVNAKFTPEEILNLFPELEKNADIDSKLVSNIMSENMRFHHYNLLAKAIADEIKNGSEGIIITHGTDFLHYTSSALSFMLENLPIPVVLIGSQRSSDRPSSDSAMNLLSAVTFITKDPKNGVFICLHEGLSDETCIIIEGTNARKMHTSRRDAFRPINKTPIARINPDEGKIKIIREPQTQDNSKSLEIKNFDENLRIGLIKVHPQMHTSEFSPFKDYDGLLIEGAGIGHAQIIAFDERSKENEKMRQELAALAKKIPVALAPQTIYGRINMNIYSPGRELLEMGILGNYCDMTPETAYIKLAWLISNYKNNHDKIKILYETNLRGEISDRSEKDTFLI